MNSDSQATFYLPTDDGGVREFQRPEFDDADWKRLFATIASAIAFEYREKEKKNLQRRKSERRAGANAWLIRVAYDLLLPMLEDGQLELLVAHCERHGRYAARGVPEGLNPFQIGLMAIFARTPQGISPQTRERLGKRLWHAARHYVPLEFVAGFIKQLDSKDLEKRVAHNEIEEGFEEWIFENINKDESILDRGNYPSNIAFPLTAETAIEEDEDYGDDEYYDEDD